MGATLPPTVANSNGHAILPGTTVPVKNDSGAANASSSGDSPPLSFSGPEVNGKPTRILLYEPSQLLKSPLIPKLRIMVNRAFSISHADFRTLPAHLDRLQREQDFHDQVGSDPGTFTYIVTDDESNEVLATASAHRYVAPVYEVSAVTGGRSVFGRQKGPGGKDESERDEDADMWELKLAAVDPDLQRQGLASYLIRLVEAEVVKRFKASGEHKKLVMLLTSIKEINEVFYGKRGYGFDYETVHEKGFMGSEGGFSIIHMSKVMDV